MLDEFLQLPLSRIYAQIFLPKRKKRLKDVIQKEQDFLSVGENEGEQKTLRVKLFHASSLPKIVKGKNQLL